jgi:hypothetical protein
MKGSKMNKQELIKKINKTIEKLEKKIPSYYIVPVKDEEEAKKMDENETLGALVLLDGAFKNCVIILHSIIMGEGDNIDISFTTLDENGKRISVAKLNEIVGNLVSYLLAKEALARLNSNDKVEEKET